MVIGIDAGCLGVKDERLKVGVYVFAKNLLTHLGKVDKSNKYHLYSFYPIDKRLLKSFGSNFKNIIIIPKTGWFSFALPLYLKFHKIDLFLGISQAIPRVKDFKAIGFIHALDFLPEYHKQQSLKKMKIHTRNLIKESDLIITTSDFLKKQIKDFAHKKEIIVLRPAASEYFTPTGAVYKENGKYFLFVGSLKPTKNIRRIIRSFSAFKRSLHNNYKLLIIGSNFWSDEDIDQIIYNEKLSKYVKFLGFVPNDKLPAYYRGAEALLSPSLYEGYGIPLIEAMSCGCPVIAGNRSAEKEIVAGGGILVDPRSEEQIVHAMEKITKNNKDYRKRAIDNAKLFSWEEVSKKLFRLIESL